MPPNSHSAVGAVDSLNVSRARVSQAVHRVGDGFGRARLAQSRLIDGLRPGSLTSGINARRGLQGSGTRGRFHRPGG